MQRCKGAGVQRCIGARGVCADVYGVRCRGTDKMQVCSGADVQV